MKHLAYLIPIVGLCLIVSDVVGDPFDFERKEFCNGSKWAIPLASLIVLYQIGTTILLLALFGDLVAEWIMYDLYDNLILKTQ
jgi:hypothetical protein